MNHDNPFGVVDTALDTYVQVQATTMMQSLFVSPSLKLEPPELIEHMSGKPLDAAFVARLWDSKFITKKGGLLSFRVELLFESPLADIITHRTLEEILQNSIPNRLADVTYVDLRKYQYLGPSTPGLLFKYCPQLTTFDFPCESFFYDHKLISTQVIAVNRYIVQAHFKALIDAKNENVFSNVELASSPSQFEHYLHLLHRKITLRQFEVILEMRSFSDLFNLLQDMHTKGTTYALANVEEAFGKKMRDITQSDKTINWRNTVLTFYPPFLRVLSDSLFEKFITVLDKPNCRGTKRVKFPGSERTKLTSKSLLLLLKTFPNLEPSCIRTLISRQEFCTLEFRTSSGETIAVNKEWLLLNHPESKILLEADLSNIAPQTIQDYLDLVLGITTEWTPRRLLDLFSFLESYKIQPIGKMRTTFIVTASALVKSNPSDQAELNALIQKIV